jgi:hypothetical protein
MEILLKEGETVTITMEGRGSIAIDRHSFDEVVKEESSEDIIRKIIIGTLEEKCGIDEINITDTMQISENEFHVIANELMREHDVPNDVIEDIKTECNLPCSLLALVETMGKYVEP